MKLVYKIMDTKHFLPFYQTNVKRVYRFLFFRVRGNKELAEDLTHDVFVKALAAFEQYDPAISQSSWIYTIARNHLINHLEKTRPGVPVEEIENTDWDRVDWGERMAVRHDERRLLEALEQLPKEDALIVKRKYLEGWSYDDIAQEIGKNSGALRVQAHRALKSLKKILKQM